MKAGRDEILKFLGPWLRYPKECYCPVCGKPLLDKIMPAWELKQRRGIKDKHVCRG